MSPVHETAQESDASDETSEEGGVTAAKSNGSNGYGTLFEGSGSTAAGSNGAEVLHAITASD
jgi:hypothetical protein